MLHLDIKVFKLVDYKPTGELIAAFDEWSMARIFCKTYVEKLKTDWGYKAGGAIIIATNGKNIIERYEVPK